MAEVSDSGAISPKLDRIAKLAKQVPKMVLTSLAHHIDVEWLREAYRRTRKDGATGVDGQTADEYALNLEANLRALLERAKSGSYRAPPVRRVHIPKGEGKTRPLGIPTFEDKILQRAVVMVLEPVYEQDFLACSHGFRPRRSAHGALTMLRDTMMEMGGGWVLEADIERFFDSISHEQLRGAIAKRVADGVLVRLIGKWLNAGVLEEGALVRPESGTPQGGVISPLLANIFLHEVLDVWFHQDVLPRLKGRAVLVRFADDFVIVFEQEDDARKVMDVLPKRFEKHGLKLHPEKTRLVPFERPPRSGMGGEKQPDAVPSSFDFLGFTHRWGRSSKGYWVVMLTTAKSRLNRAAKSISEWCRKNRHRPVREQSRVLNAKLLGHFAYFGVGGNHGALHALGAIVYATWRKWLNRRSQRARVTWEKMRAIIARYPLPQPPRRLKQLRG